MSTLQDPCANPYRGGRDHDLVTENGETYCRACGAGVALDTKSFRLSRRGKRQQSASASSGFESEEDVSEVIDAERDELERQAQPKRR